MAKVLISFSQVLPLGIKPLTIGMNITISIDFGGQPSRAYPKSRKAHAFVSFDHILSPPQIRVCPSQIFLISLSQCISQYFTFSDPHTGTSLFYHKVKWVSTRFRMVT